MANYNTDTTITSNLADGEGISIIGDSVVVTIDASVFIPTMRYGSITSTTTGTLRVKNNTNNMLIIDMALITRDIRFEANGKLFLEGGWIEVMTSNGTAGQTIDFSSIGGNGDSIDHPTAVWVEETPGGKLVPFMSLGDATADTYSLPFTGDQTGVNYGGIAGDYDRGRFYTFNRSTRVATFGDGTNGYIIPTGCKVYFANIHLTCSDWTPSVTSFSARPQFDFNINGTFIADKVNFGYFYCNVNNALVNQSSYISADVFYNVDVYEVLKLDNIAVCPLTTHTTKAISNALNVTDFQGEGSEFTNIYVAGACDYGSSSSTPTIANLYGESNVLCENIWAMWVDRRNNTDTRVGNAVNFYRYADTVIKNLTMIGGNPYMITQNCNILNLRHCGTPFVPSPTATFFPTKWRTISMQVSGSNNKCIGGTNIPDGLPPYNIVNFNDLLGKNNEVYEYNFDYPTYTNWNVVYAFRQYSDNCVYKNCIINSDHYLMNSEVDAVGSIVDNVRGLRSNGGSTRRGVRLNMVSYNNTPVLTVGSPMFLSQFAGGASDEGYLKLVFGPPLTAGTYEFSYTGTTSFFNNSSYIYLESGASVTFSNRDPIKGLLSFRDDDYIEGQNIDVEGEFTIEVEMVKASQEFTGTFTTLTFDSPRNLYSSFQALLDALPNYNSNLGFNMRVRITSLFASLQNLYYFGIPVTIDTTYKAVDAYVTIEGGNETDQYEMRRKDNTSVLFSWEGVGRYDFPVGSLVGVEVYFVRYILSEGTYDRAASNKPFPTTLQYGDNGIVKLYVGNEIQTASTDPSTIWNYTTRTTTEGFTTSDRDQLNKGLTTGKFLALK